MNIVLVFPSALANSQVLVRAIKKSGKIQVTSEDACIACKADDPAEVTSRLRGFSGIDHVTIARKVPSRFSDITEAIVQEGIKAILPKERFYVKVIQTAKADYVDRDIEFASTGMLVGKLAQISVLPTKSEQDADRVILAIVSKRWAYICVKDTT